MLVTKYGLYEGETTTLVGKTGTLRGSTGKLSMSEIGTVWEYCDSEEPGQAGAPCALVAGGGGSSS